MEDIWSMHGQHTHEPYTPKPNQHNGMFFIVVYVFHCACMFFIVHVCFALRHMYIQ